MWHVSELFYLLALSNAGFVCSQVWNKEIRKTTRDNHMCNGLLKPGLETSSALTTQSSKSDSVIDSEPSETTVYLSLAS